MSPPPNWAADMADKLLVLSVVKDRLGKSEEAGVFRAASAAIGALLDEVAAQDMRAHAAAEAGRDLVALVEVLGDHLDPARATPLKRRMWAARVNRTRDALGLPRPARPQLYVKRNGAAP